MSYISLINNFWDLNMEKHFSQLETAYYFYLLNICNRSRWRKVFELSNKDFINLYGCTQGQLRIARNHLVDAGLIVYYPGKMNRAVRYSINIPEYLSDNEKMHHEKQLSATPEDLSHDENSVKREANETDTKINRQTVERELNQHKEGNTENASESEFDSDWNNSERKRDEHERILRETRNAYEKESNGNSFKDKTRIYKTRLEKPNTLSGRKITPDEIAELYHETCPSLPYVSRLTSDRLKRLKNLIRDYPERSFWKEYFDKVNDSDWLMGRIRKEDGSSFKANFDWLINEDNMVKVIEGNYLQGRRDRMDEISEIIDREYARWEASY